MFDIGADRFQYWQSVRPSILVPGKVTSISYVCERRRKTPRKVGRGIETKELETAQ